MIMWLSKIHISNNPLLLHNLIYQHISQLSIDNAIYKILLISIFNFELNSFLMLESLKKTDNCKYGLNNSLRRNTKKTKEKVGEICIL